jgi:creatinine amidohydrolase
MLPLVAAGDRAATMVSLAEALTPKETDKNTSTAEMSPTGVRSERNPREATAERGRRDVEVFVDVAVRFIDRWTFGRCSAPELGRQPTTVSA